jgi:hypothetical protein
MRRVGSIWIKVFLLVTLLANAAAADEARLIPLRHRTAAEMIPLLQPLLGPGDAIGGSDYRLILRTSDKNFKEIEKLIAQLDTAKRQFRIQVRQTAAEHRGSAGIGVGGEYQTDNTRIQLPRQSTGNGGLIVRRNGVEVQTNQTRTTSTTANTQFITVLDGAPAFVRVGQSVPHVQRVLALAGKQQLFLAQGISYQHIVSGFDVIARAQRDGVLLEITPRLSSVTNPTTGVVSFQEFSTTVLAKPGDWIDIGGIEGIGSDIRRAILDIARSNSGEQRTVQLKVE